MTDLNLNTLAAQWQAAKAAETKANQERLIIEQQIAELVGVKDEGVTSVNTDLFRIKTTGKQTRTVDTDAVQQAWPTLPNELQDCFAWKATLDTKAYRALASLRDDLLPQLNQFITSKPAKPAISIEQNEHTEA